MMKRSFLLMSAVVCSVALTSSARADALPSDPWAATNVVQVQQVGPVIYGSQPYQPTYEGGDSNVWNTRMPEFTGEMTTWGDSPNAKYNAPEVNMHNLLSITGHLRRMGYKIPTSFEERFKAAAAAVRVRIMDSLRQVQAAKDPFSRSTVFLLKKAEAETGLSFTNLVGNSLDLMSAK